MRNELINLTKELISINSVSRNNNYTIINKISTFLENCSFYNEISKYTDPQGVEKFNLVSHRGNKSGGLVFLIHSDTVPLAFDDQIKPKVLNNRIYGRGACDMKGPAAAALLAIRNSDNSDLPITVIVTSDEEIGCEGAQFTINNSKLLKSIDPIWGITTEPTELIPVYAHKGLCQITVNAYGKAAHSSTSIGESANFKMVPFLYFISKLKEKYNIDKSYHNSEFIPETNTLNLTISDFNCALNVTAARSRCQICFRTMPNSRTDEIISEITSEANKLGLENSFSLYDSLYIDPNSEIVKKAEIITGNKSQTVAYLTDASQFSSKFSSIILGPGSIKQGHTKDEYIDIDKLEDGYNIYKKLIKSFS